MIDKRIAGLFALLIFYSCGNEKADPIQKTENKIDTTAQVAEDEEESFVKKNKVRKEATPEDLKPVSDNFNRINAIEKWTSTVKKDFGETTEGGEADYCYSEGNLEKIVYRQFGETFQKITEFYLLKGEVSFVFEKESKYNRPIYWDSTAMKENGDNQVWDAEKSEILETRNFFKDGKLIHQLPGKALSSVYLAAEQKRLEREFEKLMPPPAQEIKP